MFRTLIVPLLLALSSLLPLAAQAGPLASDGFSVSADGTFVIGPDGREYLRWDQTAGLSIAQALGAFGADGWSLATNADTKILLDALVPEAIWPENDTELSLLFSQARFDRIIELFGSTTGDAFTAALFGEDLNGNGLVNQVAFLGPLNFLGSIIPPGGGIGVDFIAQGGSNVGNGVLLVRGVQVPAPPVLGAFAVLLFTLRRRALRG